MYNFFNYIMLGYERKGFLSSSSQASYLHKKSATCLIEKKRTKDRHVTLSKDNKGIYY